MAPILFLCVANLRHSNSTIGECIVVLTLLWVCVLQSADLCITCRLLAATHILALVAVCLQEVSPQYRSVCGSHVRLQLFSSSYSYQESQLHVKILKSWNDHECMFSESVILHKCARGNSMGDLPVSVKTSRVHFQVLRLSFPFFHFSLLFTLDWLLYWYQNQFLSLY